MSLPHRASSQLTTAVPPHPLAAGMCDTNYLRSALLHRYELDGKARSQQTCQLTHARCNCLKQDHKLHILSASSSLVSQ